MSTVKSFVSGSQFERSKLLTLFTLADDIKEHPKSYSNILSSKIITTLFFEPSTRTRLSFESAIQRLGGHLLTVENGELNSSSNKGESIADTIRIVEGYSDGIIMRHKQTEACQIAASISEVPIINAGDGSGEHPTQSLLDLYTIHSYKKKLDNLSIAIIGDLKYGRTVHSLVHALCLFENITIYGVSNEEFELPTTYDSLLLKHKIKYIKCRSLDELPLDIDVIYQTRLQNERTEAESIRDSIFVITKKIIEKFSPTTILMHPLPRNKEIDVAVDKDKRAVYFEQAKNGLYIRMALLTYIFNEEEQERLVIV
ncbi:aspartate carbamoyltransferase [Bacillus spongiae]|uniref:Aspartate carbamoyltransferase n=1 Tax=Bacillus spongiae TaxID=2683610 RepID=A0ABU8HIW1_9BACI